MKGRVLSHASMNVKKRQQRAGSQTKRSALDAAVRPNAAKVQRSIGGESPRAAHEDSGTGEVKLAAERGGTPPALPNPIATFTI